MNKCKPSDIQYLMWTFVLNNWEWTRVFRSAFLYFYPEFEIGLQNFVDHVLDHLQDWDRLRVRNQEAAPTRGQQRVDVCVSSSSFIVVLPPLSPEPLHCGGNLNCSQLPSWLLSQSLTSASSDAIAAVCRRRERLQANTTVLCACMMLSFCAPIAAFFFFLSRQSLDARWSNRNKEEQRRKTIGRSIKEASLSPLLQHMAQWCTIT